MNHEGYREKKQHGAPDFPMEYYDIDVAHPRYELQLHWPRELEVVRVRQGALHLYLNNTEYVLGAGELALIGSGVLHRADPCDAAYECVVFHLNMLSRQASGRIGDYVLPLLGGEVDQKRLMATPDLASTLSRLIDCLCTAQPYYELEAYSLVARVALLLYRGGCIRPGSRTDHRRHMMAELLHWIEKNYAAPITLQQLAEIAKVSEKYLCRFFKEYTGNSPIDYINRLRVERACLSMSEEGKNITEAAFENGFNDISYFSKIFKRYKGMTPREYRGTRIRI